MNETALACVNMQAILDAYAEQIASGSTPENALLLAAIVYQQRQPDVSFDDARDLVRKLLHGA